ncbi:MAG: DUF58 domain-containing protein [Anaerobacillus sp.]|uniref:DUF58 domain-containing protein n=1 Tax=Anaerobacillus sp. TaxID=1872506 RepID=UPI003918A077
MNWYKQFKHPKVYISLYSSIIILLFFVLFTGSAIIFSLCLLIGFFILLNNKYLDYLSQKVRVPTEKHIIRLYPEDKGELLIPVENNGKLPIFSGDFRFELHDSEKAVKVVDMADSYDSFYHYRMSLLPQKRKKHKVRLKALKRGIVQVRSIEFTIYDLLSFGSAKLSYLGNYRGEVIVYPTIKPVLGIERVIQSENGDQQKNSLHEDIMQSIGTRDYISSDPFNKINWKATAKSQQLQTKVFEKTTVSKWTMVINMKDDQRLRIDNLEQVLSNVAYCCQYATINNIQYEIFVNIKTPGAVCLHLPLGSGKVHLMKALEFLARIRKDSSTIKSTYMLNTVRKSVSPVVLHFGAFNMETYRLYTDWKRRKNIVIYQLHIEGENGHFVRIGGVKNEVMAN